MLTLAQTAALLGVSTGTVKTWHHAGLITGHPFNDKGECLYEIPAVAPVKKVGRPPKNRCTTETLPERA